MFSLSCFEGSTCLANVVIGTVVTFKFVNTCGCVCFVYGFVCFRVFHCDTVGIQRTLHLENRRLSKI